MHVQPYLYFEGRSQEAIDFYKSVLGAEVEVVMHFKDAPPEMQAQIEPGQSDKIMHAAIKVGDTSVLISDGRCGGKAVFSGIALTLNVDSDADADSYFAALSKSGQVTMPISKTFFASRFGMVNDKFGVSWIVIRANAP
jgi:PhnB protein